MDVFTLNFKQGEGRRRWSIKEKLNFKQGEGRRGKRWSIKEKRAFKTESSSLFPLTFGSHQ
jgi:hypothetical protein